MSGTRTRAATRCSDWYSVTDALSTALPLWRGVPLADVDSVRLHRDERPAMVEAQVASIELFARAALQQDRAAEAITSLREMTALHPHRERTHALLMSALAADGRRGEALKVYRELHDTLVRDLGIEPDAELKRLQAEILRTEQGLASGAIAIRPRLTPQSLPPDTADFTGRDSELRFLVELLSQDPEPGSPPVVVIDGMGGMGKSTLALHAAHRAGPGYPDGRLFADLRGTSAHPVEPAIVLGSFLHLLGVPAAEMPADPQERSALFRTLVADRRMLIVLDDARDAAQLTALLPASSGSAVLVTARHKLFGLAGCHRISLQGLSRAESRTLLDRIVGSERTGAEPGATEAVLSACVNLPLALRIAGGRLASRPHWRVQDLAARFEATARRLAELTFAEHDLRASFEVGLAGLAESDGLAAQAFGLLGLWRGTGLELGALASLLGRPVEQAESIAEHLVDVHMLLSPGSGRYVLHDLLREFAAEQVHRVVSAAERGAAVARLVGWYVCSSAAMDRALRLATLDAEPSGSSLEGVTGVHHPAGPADALAWGEREHANLAEAMRLCAEYGLARLASRLTFTSWSFYYQQRHLQSWVDTCDLAVAIVRKHGDCDQEASVCNNLAIALSASGRGHEAVPYLERCVEIRESQANFERLSRALSNLGIASMEAGDPDRAVIHFQRSLEMRTTSDGEAFAQTNLGHFYLLLGRYEEAIAHSEAADRIHRASEVPNVDHASVLGDLADAHRKRGDLERALRYSDESVTLLRRFSSSHALIESLDRLASILEECGRREQARATRAEAAALAVPEP